MSAPFNSFVGKRHYQDFVNRLQHLVKNYGKLEEIGRIDDFPLYKVVLNPRGVITVCFIAGIHGDEPGGPLGILSFLKDRIRIPKKVRVIIIPMANPTGFENDKRRNDDNKDINRHFLDGKPTSEGKLIYKVLIDEKIKLLVTLHEDPEARHFYLYYTKFQSLAEMIRDVASKYFRIHQGPKIRHDKGENGLIPPPHKKMGTIEDRFAERGIAYFTTEPPGTEPLAKRVKFMKEVIKLVLHNI